MINVSNEFKTTMTERTDFKPSALFSFQDGRTLTLTDKDFSISNNIVTDGAESRSFPLGVAVGRSIQLEITNYEEQYSDYDFNMAVIRLKLNFQLSDTVESIDFGKYTVTEPESYGSTIIVQAVDDMYKANKDYDTALNFPASLGSLVTDSCRTCGIDIQTAAFKNDDFLVQKKPENITHRQFLALAAMLAGGYARMNRQGRLCINTYDLSGFEENPEDVDIKTVTPAENYHIFTLFTSSPSIATDDVVITGIRTQDENDKEYFFGEEGYVLEIDNQLIEGMEETAISLIGGIIVGLRFRPFTADHIAYPVAEFGDLCYVVDRNKNIYQSILTDICFTFYGITTLKCAADSPLRNSSRMNSEAVKAVTEARKNTEKLLSAYDIAVQTMNQLAANTMGFFSTTVRQPDGSVIAYRHDKPTLAESKVVYKSGIDGFWVTQDFQGTDEATEAAGKWSSGLDSSGNAVLNILSVIGINFDWARGGAISIEDESGTPIFYANMDTKEVNISGDTVTIGGKKAPEAIEEALEEAKKARNLNMILDNEYQGIPADAEGNIDPFPEVQTGVQVFYGNTDISAECSYDIVKADSVTGNWDSTHRIYTVTGLTADTGWVDIKATYLTAISATKRFNIQKIKDGAPGKDGIDGIDGANGVGVLGAKVTYQTSSSGTTIPTGTWQETIPTVSAGQYLWTRTQFNYSDGSSSSSYSVSRMGTNGSNGKDGTDGENGADGRGIRSTEITYQASSSGTTAPMGTWSTSVPGVSEGNYLWTRTVITYTDNTTSVSYSVGRMGKDGAQGIPGSAGEDGKTSYFHIKYSAVSNPTSSSQMSELPNTYIGTYVDFTQADSNNPSDYTWAKFRGDKGADGIPGTNGENGQTSYLHIAYANNSMGTEGFSTTVSADKKYIGQYVDFTQADSTDPGKYSWSKIKGEDGQDGTAARTYFIEPSATVLKRSQNNTISPNFIEFKAYYRDGNSTERTAYAGRFKIEETTDGNTWKTLYTSSSNETSVRHELYSAVATAADQVIVNANNDYIGVPRDVVQVRCTLYEAGGMTNTMDIQSVAVVTDVDALTPLEVLKLVTQGMEGIYSPDGIHYYINASAIMAGILQSIEIISRNGNEWLRMLDSILTSGNGTDYNDIDGLLDLSANYGDGTYKVVLEARTSDLILKAHDLLKFEGADDGGLVPFGNVKKIKCVPNDGRYGYLEVTLENGQTVIVGDDVIIDIDSLSRSSNDSIQTTIQNQNAEIESLKKEINEIKQIIAKGDNL